MADRTDIFDDDFIAQLQQLRLGIKRLTARRGAGLARSRRVGDGLEFADHRDYAPGDDVRFIDWPYYARMGQLLLRLFHEHSDAEVAILLDISHSTAPGGDPALLHYALRTTAALAFVAMAGMDRVSINPFSDRLQTPMHCGRSKENILAVLDYLAGLQAGGQTDLARPATELARRAQPGTLAVIVSDLLTCGPQLDEALSALRVRHCDVLVVHLVHAPHAEVRLDGPMQLTDAETGETMALDVTPALRDAFRDEFERFRNGVERTTGANGATYVTGRTDLPFQKLVLEAVRRNGGAGR